MAVMMPPHWVPRRNQDGSQRGRSGSTRPSSSQDLVVYDEARREPAEQRFGTTRPGGASLAVWDLHRNVWRVRRGR